MHLLPLVELVELVGPHGVVGLGATVVEGYDVEPTKVEPELQG